MDVTTMSKLFSAPSLVLIALLASAASARGQIQEVSASAVAETRRMQHPATVHQVLRVGKDHEEGATALQARYWRTSRKKAGRGRVLVEVEIQRSTGAGVETVCRVKDRSRVTLRRWSRSWGPLPALQTGDLILVTFRFRKVPAIARFDAVYAETILDEVAR